MPTRRTFVAVAAVLALAGPAAATFTASVLNGAGLSVSTGSLSAPTDLAATPGCDGALQAKVTLTWSVTPSPWATGYVVRRRVGLGGYATVGTVTGRNATTFTDTTTLALGTAYDYVVQASYQSWTKDSAPTSVTTPTLC